MKSFVQGFLALTMFLMVLTWLGQSEDRSVRPTPNGIILEENAEMSYPITSAFVRK